MRWLSLTKAVFEEEIGSASNTIYARAVDGRAAASTFQMQESNRATNRAEIRRHWGRVLREALEKLLTDGIQQ